MQAFREQGGVRLTFSGVLEKVTQRKQHSNQVSKDE